MDEYFIILSHLVFRVVASSMMDSPAPIPPGTKLFNNYYVYIRQPNSRVCFGPEQWLVTRAIRNGLRYQYIK